MTSPRLAAAALVLAVSLPGCAEPGPLPGPLPGNITLEGKWESNWGDMVLSQTGDRIKGTFAHRNGTLEGRLAGDLLLFDWSQPGNKAEGVLSARGKGWLRVSQDGGVLEGVWGYREHRDGGGIWRAERPEQR